MYQLSLGPGRLLIFLVSLDQHGASLATLYRQAERSNDGRQQNAGNLVIALDGSGNAFGAYINEPISKREGAYYGGGDSYVLTTERNQLTHQIPLQG